jgi:cbb3-type cytochrome oxidase cytochrome c subunit
LIRWFWVGIPIVLLGIEAAYAKAFPPEEDAERLPAGLVAAYLDGTQFHGPEVSRVESNIAFFLKEGQSPHPRIDSRAWSARWRGQIQLFRAGRYRFSAELIGRVRVRVGAQVVLVAEAESNRAEPMLGPEVDLPAGSLAVEAEFSKSEGPARLRVFWQSSFFSREPLPWDVLRHAASDISPQLIRSMQEDRGRFLVEELSCVACHRAADDDALGRGLSRRQGPDLSRVGERTYPGWIERWLASPQAFRAQATMPQMFADNELGRMERYAVASYLASLGGPPRSPKQEQSRDELRNFRRRGERLFARIGCSVCHAASDSKDAIADLKHMGSKTTTDRLAQFLQNPLAVDPFGRMPQMGLDAGEARDLAHFLCESVDETCPRELPALPVASEEVMRTLVKQVAESGDEAARLARALDTEKFRVIGERLVVVKGCTNCHRVAPGGKELPARPAATAWSRLRSLQGQSRGCLQETSGSVVTPRFAFSDEHRQCIRAFLSGASTGAGSAAPAFAAYVTVRRLQCVACHSRAGQGGLESNRVEELRRHETVQDAEAIQPPPLTDVGARLRSAWLGAVLTQGRRARPWMGLRMPQFGSANVGDLTEQLAAADGVDSSDTIHQFAYDAQHVEAGRFLVGKKGFGCISCHDIAGQPNTGTRGPDLASIHERVRFDWYSRWLDDPQRIQPGTRMPTVFQNGTTAIKTVLDGNARAQSQAIWEYLSLGANLPLPDGLEPPKGLVLQPKQKPIVLRSFMPDAGSRAIAVGFPTGLSFAFDPTQGRLAYAWTGQFLDAGPIWQNRGGSPAGIQGPRFWTAPPGCPWELTDSPGRAPDWSQRLTDPARGARLAEGELFEGQLRLRFREYKIADDGSPSFRYDLAAAPNGDEKSSMEIYERLHPIQKLAGVGMSRSFELQSTRTATAWLLVAEEKTAVQVMDGHGDPVDFQPNAELAELTPIGRPVLVTGPTGVQLISALAAPADAQWILTQSSGKWRLALRVPMSGSASARIVVAVLCPYRNEPAMIRALLPEISAP